MQLRAQRSREREPAPLPARARPRSLLCSHACAWAAISRLVRALATGWRRMQLAQEVEIFFSYDFHSNKNAPRFCRARVHRKRFRLRLKLKHSRSSGRQKPKPKPIPIPTPKPAKPTTDSLARTHRCSWRAHTRAHTLARTYGPWTSVVCGGTKTYFVLVITKANKKQNKTKSKTNPDSEKQTVQVQVFK